MLSHFITDFFEYVYEQYLIHVNSVSTYLYHVIPILFGPRGRHRDALQNVNENLVLFVFGVILSWSNLWQVHMAHGHGSALGLAFGLDGGKRSSFVKDCESIF